MAHPSDSREQRIAEKLILNGLEDYMGIPSGSLEPKKIMLSDTVKIEVDGYSERYRIMVEVFARIGHLAPAHTEKLANDILKLNLAEDILKTPYNKYLAICGEDAERYLNGSSWKSFAATHYDFKIVKVDLSENDRNMILNAQKRQKEGMKL